MSARKAEIARSLHPVTLQARQTRLSLSHDSVIFHKTGIEFRSSTPFSVWAEMTVTLQACSEGGTIHCAGVVISCTGSKHTGFHVSMLFTSLSRQARARLGTMAFSPPA